MPTLQVAAGISVNAKPYKFSKFLNYCNRCGLCCEMLIEWQMTHADPDDPHGQLHKGVCVYLDGKAGEGKITSCEITDGTVDIDTIPAHHKMYYLRECAPHDGFNGTWPNPDDPKHWPTSGSLRKPRGVESTGCSFRKVTVVIPD